MKDPNRNDKGINLGSRILYGTTIEFVGTIRGIKLEGRYSFNVHNAPWYISLMMRNRWEKENKSVMTPDERAKLLIEIQKEIDKYPKEL